MKYQVTDAPTGIGNPLYKLTKTIVKASNLKKSMEGTKEQVLANAAAANAKNRHFVMPADSKAHYTDHMILGAYDGVSIDSVPMVCYNTNTNRNPEEL